MLALLLTVGEKVCAIPARAVVEVVAKVELRSTPEAPPWMPGLFAYRGSILPVVDLCMRIERRPCPSLLASRIVVVQRASGRSEDWYGLLSESVTDVRALNEDAKSGANVELAAYVQRAVLQEGKLIHILDLEQIVSASGALRLGAGSAP
ncbi:MAG TPA: chemotaxis protein CheW [Polyangiales bacterium]